MTLDLPAALFGSSYIKGETSWSTPTTDASRCAVSENSSTALYTLSEYVHTIAVAS